MVRVLAAMVNASTAQAPYASPPMSSENRPLGRHSRLDTLRELKGSAFSFARIAKQLAFHRVETVRRGEEPVPTGIANHDAGSLR
jgi:hypothetical protein